MPEGSTTAATPETDTGEQSATARVSSDYTLPLVHMRIPAKAVHLGFWGGLAGAVALGAVDPPLGVLVGAGVVIARHQAKS